MIKNAFSDILLNWKYMKDGEKKRRVQDLENMLARRQGRKQRTITFGNDKKLLDFVGEGRSACALYCRNNDRFHIFDLDTDSGEIIKNIIHEGIHALIGDSIKGTAKLKLYTNFNREKFLIEEENLEAIRAYFKSKDMMPLFDSFFIEERLNYKEDSIIFINMLFELIENTSDIERLFPYLMSGIDIYASNEHRGKLFEQKYGTTYDDIVINALNNPLSSEKDDMSKVRFEQRELDDHFMQFFDSELNNFMNYISISRSKVYNPVAKENEIEKILEKIAEEFANYAIVNILAKKKN